MDTNQQNDEISKEIFENKAKRRMELREYFLKNKLNPFKHLISEGGTVFDPAFMRYQAYHMYKREWFRPSKYNGFIGIFFLVLPLSLTFYAIRETKLYEEGKMRRGEVAYKDRRFKFI